LSTINPFTYSAKPADFNLRLVKQTRRWRHFQVTFPVAAANHYPGADIARGEYFEPITNTQTPLVIMIHGWGDHSVLPFEWMLAGFLRKGIACFILYQPFHASRLADAMKSRLYSLTIEEWFISYQVAVTDVQHIIDWASRSSKIDTGRIMVMGLSLGAFVASMAMGIDRRIKSGIFIVHGGNTGKIMQTNFVSRLRKGIRLPEDQYLQNQKNYAQYLVDVSNLGFANVTPLQNTYLIDPLTYAPMLKGRPVLMLNARWDETIPLPSAREFQKACGSCPLLVYPANHAGIWVWYPLIICQINRFMESNQI
jgi:predicted esterase